MRQVALAFLDIEESSSTTLYVNNNHYYLIVNLTACRSDGAARAGGYQRALDRAPRLAVAFPI